jgi:hypothetical protein
MQHSAPTNHVFHGPGPPMARLAMSMPRPSLASGGREWKKSWRLCRRIRGGTGATLAGLWRRSWGRGYRATGAALPARSGMRSAGSTLKRVPSRCLDRGALVLVVVWLLVLAGAACQRDGLTGAGHHHLLGPDLSRHTSRQMVHHLGLAAVQSRYEEVCGRVDVWWSSW